MIMAANEKAEWFPVFMDREPQTVGLRNTLRKCISVTNPCGIIAECLGVRWE